jgi:hypothetical protein
MSNSDYRVSLKFSEKDAEQEEVVKLLKQMGRRKSLFITKAIKFYLKENPEADIPGVTSTTISKSSVRAILKELLSEMNIQDIQNLQNNDTTKEAQPVQKEESTSTPKKEEVSDTVVDAFLEGLEAWDMGEY